MKRAACVGMIPGPRTYDDDGNEVVVRDPFFPERGQSHRDAQMVCFNCGVRPQCKKYSERIGATYGVWSGAIKKRGGDQ
ncbi:WhiB family transcriptional regulator [Streptomyces wedmorensis]|uniref:WhiB family transcriptional regulator n=1 Tax=Streptomyces wedmorensis TaxID=43759 RepID=UPI00341AA967